jgi:hypothetical protein
LSVDLDEIPNYFQIHGLREPSGSIRTRVYDVALERIAEFADELHIPVTFFAIGADLRRVEAARALETLAKRGHEIANHSLDHMYEFSRLPREGMRTQVEGGIRAIRDATGVLPTGFRAPGYTINDQVFSVLQELGVTYDSSVFPCPAYYLAKGAAIANIQLRGRQSRSILDHPNVLRAPTVPYRVGSSFFRRGSGMIELPVQVTRVARLPFIGTSVALAGRMGALGLARMCADMPLINLEMHGIDFLDAKTDGLEALALVQPDTRINWRAKLATYRAVVEHFAAQGYAATTLDAAARSFAASRAG